MVEKKLIMGIVATSTKENESRVAIFPEHFNQIDKNIQQNIFFEYGYGDKFNISNDQLKKQFGGVMSREELFKKCGIITRYKYVGDVLLKAMKTVGNKEEYITNPPSPFWKRQSYLSYLVYRFVNALRTLFGLQIIRREPTAIRWIDRI